MICFVTYGVNIYVSKHKFNSFEKNVRYSNDFCWFLLKFCMILADFLLLGSGSISLKRIRIRLTKMKQIQTDPKHCWFVIEFCLYIVLIKGREWWTILSLKTRWSERRWPSSWETPGTTRPDKHGRVVLVNVKKYGSVHWSHVLQGILRPCITGYHVQGRSVLWTAQFDWIPFRAILALAAYVKILKFIVKFEEKGKFVTFFLNKKLFNFRIMSAGIYFDTNQFMVKVIKDSMP